MSASMSIVDALRIGGSEPGENRKASYLLFASRGEFDVTLRRRPWDGFRF
jgi:hypothetical protein